MSVHDSQPGGEQARRPKDPETHLPVLALIEGLEQACAPGTAS